MGIVFANCIFLPWFIRISKHCLLIENRPPECPIRELRPQAPIPQHLEWDSMNIFQARCPQQVNLYFNINNVHSRCFLRGGPPSASFFFFLKMRPPALLFKIVALFALPKFSPNSGIFGN